MSHFYRRQAASRDLLNWQGTELPAQLCCELGRLSGLILFGCRIEKAYYLVMASFKFKRTLATVAMAASSGISTFSGNLDSPVFKKAFVASGSAENVSN